MMIIFFLNGLAFGGLGLAAYLQNRQGSDLPLRKHLIWLAAFGFAYGLTNWADMFLASSGTDLRLTEILVIARMVLQPLSGLLLLKFGWGILKEVPLPRWAIFIPGVLIVPIAYVISYAITTFITPSPVEIPIDIWSRYLLYLPGSIMAGIGFMRQWRMQVKNRLPDVANLMLGAGLAFLFEAFIVGLVVPAAPYAPSSYYNYDRVLSNAFAAGTASASNFSGFTSWLDYQSILTLTGLPIQFWRMLSSFAVTFFVVRGLGVFEARRKIQLDNLEKERDLAQEAAFEGQVAARRTAEKWTEVLVNINRRIIQFDDVDKILLYIIEQARDLLNSDLIGLGLLNENQFSLEIKCYSNKNETRLVDIPEELSALNFLDASHDRRSNLTAEDFPPGALGVFDHHLGQPASDVGVVRLELENRPIGMLWAARTNRVPFSETDLIWLECMADQVDIAIQHSLMTSQLQSLSITEERGRIARDMHDGLAQILGYLNVQVQTLGALLKQGKDEQLADELDQMRQAVKTANADVRDNILSLRTTLASEKGLVSSIGEYLDEFGIQTGIETTFANEIRNGFNLSSIAEVQLVCIFQEILANVRKHSRAKQVCVCLRKLKTEEEEHLFLQVSDDGVGIRQYDEQRHFGIKTIMERAGSVGGKVSIQSGNGSGTTVECWIPCLGAAKLKNTQPLFPDLIKKPLPSNQGRA